MTETENVSNASGTDALDEDELDYFPGDVPAPCQTLEATQPAEMRAKLRLVACTLIGDGLVADDVRVEGNDVVAGDRRVTLDTERSARVHAYCIALAMVDVLSRIVADRNARRLGV